MRANRRRDTAPELRLRQALFAAGLRYRTSHRIRLPGAAVAPDIVFPRRRLAIFIDGCFWHACPSHGTWPRTNSSYWQAKLERNVERDRAVDAALGKAGWLVLRLWEHEPTAVGVDRVRQLLTTAAPA